MSYPVYTVPSGDVLPVLFDTFDGGTGASCTLTGLAVTDIEIYKDGGTTQRASDAGYTLLDTDGIDFDGVTGIHGFSIDTGDNTDAGFYAVGSWYHVVVSSVTVDAQTVNFIACAFRIMAAEANAGIPKTDINAITAGAITATAIADNAIDIATFAADCKTGSALKANVETISNDAITAASIAAGAIDNATFAADVGSTAYATNVIALATRKALDDYDPPTKAELDTAQGAVTVSAIGAGAITAAAIATGAIDADAVAADAVAEIADGVWDEVLSGHSGVGSAGAALTAAGSSGDPWSTALPGAYGAGTAGKALSDVLGDTNELQTNQGNWLTATGFSTHSAADVAALVLVTPAQKLVTDASGYVTANMNGDFTATQKSSITTAVPTAAAISDAVWDEASTGHTDAGKAGDQLWTVLNDVPSTSEFEARTLAAADYTIVSDLGTVQTGDSFAIVNGDHGLVSIQDDIDAIKLKTDNLPSGITKNTELANFEFLMVLASDHITPATGKTITATRSIDGGAFGACANSASEVGSGVYKITLANTDLNGDVVTLKFSEAACDARYITILTEPA